MIGPSAEALKAWTDWTTPERVKNVARMVRAKQAMASDRFQMRSSPRRSSTTMEWTKAVPQSHGSKAAFSTGSQPPNPPQPSTW